MSKQNKYLDPKDSQCVSNAIQRRAFIKSLAVGVGSLSFAQQALSQASNPGAISAAVSLLLDEPKTPPITDPEPATLPSVVTNAAFDILSISAKITGEVLDDGGADIIERGVVFATTDLPTVISGTKVVDVAAEEGEFTVSILGLSILTLYNARAFATNSVGTTYGNQVSFLTLNIL